MDIAFIVISILLVIADGFTVHGPSDPLVVPLGSSVVLPCYVDEPLPVKSLEVEWRRTDSETQVHLFVDGESRPEVQQEDYHDRAHFFTNQIQHGNFSLLLENLTAEDEGKYTCKVYSQQDSGETVVQIKYEHLLVSGSSRSISAYAGEDVTLNCSVDSHITPEHIEEVSWKKIDEDGDIPVLLYQNNETFPGSSDEQFRDRVEFFTDQIPKGNFSLRLKSVRTEDKGVYMCQVFAGELSANATVIFEQLGFSHWHIIVLIFCFVAALGSVLLFCSLMYCKSRNTVSSSTIWKLLLSLIFFPNICMSIAFIFWGIAEGFLDETITCSALYILRPVMLIWALPYLKYFQGNIKTWIRFFRLITEFAVFTVIVYSVFFTNGWRLSAHDTDNKRRDLFVQCFVLGVLSCLFTCAADFMQFSKERIREMSCPLRLLVQCLSRFIVGICFLSLFQMVQLIVSFGLPSPAFLSVVFVLPLLLLCITILPRLQAKFKFLDQRWITLLWMITIPLLDLILVIYIHLTLLERQKEYLGWICVIVFIELLKMIVIFQKHVTDAESSRNQRRQQQIETSQQTSNALNLCNLIMYMFGAVGLVLLNSVTLTAELILKARNGERFLKDLRLLVFSPECVFAFYWLVLQMHSYWKIVTTESTHNQRNSHELRNTAETHETMLNQEGLGEASSNDLTDQQERTPINT